MTWHIARDFLDFDPGVAERTFDWDVGRDYVAVDAPATPWVFDFSPSGALYLFTATIGAGAAPPFIPERHAFHPLAALVGVGG